MQIEKILKNIEYIKINNINITTDVSKISNNSKDVDEKSIFVAIRGFKQDGHKYITEALEKGAKVIVCEDSKYINNNIPAILVKDSRITLSRMSNILFEEPSKKMNLIGVTGTNGKTSITYILEYIFKKSNINTGIMGTIGASFNGKKITLNNTTPEANYIHKILKDMFDEKISTCFMEVSSHSTSLHRIDDIDFNIGIFTNLTKDHLDFHKTMEEYYKAKKAFFKNVKLAIINIDDPYGERLYNELKEENLEVLSYSIHNKSDYQAKIIKTNIEGTYFNLKIKNKVYKFHVKTPGKFNVYNTLGAIVVSLNLKLKIQDIIKSLNEFPGVIGRFEIMPTKLKCTIILDFAHTPDGLEKIMETIDEVAKGRKIVMFGAGGERDVSRRALMGEVAGKYCDVCYLTSDNPRYENPTSICEEIARGVKKHHNNYKIIVDRGEAINYIIDNYGENDIILLAGKSTEPYQDTKGKKIPYFERQIALEAIKTKELSEKAGN